MIKDFDPIDMPAFSEPPARTKERWAKTYVRANIKGTEKSLRCKMPDLVAYPGGSVPLRIGKPVDQVSAPLLMAELLYEFSKEVARRTVAASSRSAS